MYILLLLLFALMLELKGMLKYLIYIYTVQNQPFSKATTLPHDVIQCDLYSNSPFCIHLLLTESYAYVSSLLLYMLMLLMGCVSLSETCDRTRAETRVLIGGLKSRQCSLSSVKVISSHKMECSLVFFINRADRLGT